MIFFVDFESMKGKARAQSITVYARPMRVRVASSPDFPKCYPCTYVP